MNTIILSKVKLIFTRPLIYLLILTVSSCSTTNSRMNVIHYEDAISIYQSSEIIEIPNVKVVDEGFTEDIKTGTVTGRVKYSGARLKGRDSEVKWQVKKEFLYNFFKSYLPSLKFN